MKIETDELIVTDVDEWLDDDVRHAACIHCTPPGAHSAGSLVIAYCGSLFRLKHGPSRALRASCASCNASRHDHSGDA